MGMAAGGLLGTGLGRGRPDLTYFAESDFIVPSFGEELGLVGLFALLILYVLLVERGLRTALGEAVEMTAVVLEAAPPPSPEVLRIVARSGLTPGVDLSGGRWATLDRAWLPGRRGIAVLRHGLDDDRGSQELAAAIRSLGLLPEGSPSLEWIRSVEQHPSRGSRPRWDEVLRAGYLEAAVDVLLEVS